MGIINAGNKVFANYKIGWSDSSLNVKKLTFIGIELIKLPQRILVKEFWLLPMISNRSRLAYNVNVKNYAVNMIEPASIIRIDFTLAVNLIKSQSGDPLTMPLPVL